MDLHSKFPYWLLKNGIINSYPSIQENEKADVAIIGAGISGALVAWYLGKAGIKTIIIDKRHAGTGSTSASTALLQYEIDIPLHELIEKVGEYNAVESYKLCLDAICSIAAPEAEFMNKPSLQYASQINHVEKLMKEYDARKKYGFQVQWLNEQQVINKYGFSKPAAILCKDGAEIDAYTFTHNVLKYCTKHFNTKVFDKTSVEYIKKTKAGFELSTENGIKINCKNVVIACGYESEAYLPEKVTKLHATYAIVSEPILNKNLWHKNSLIWETADPYLYIRTTKDKRILIGGKDTPYTSATARDKKLSQKVKALEESFATLFPSIPFKTDFSWAGTFAGTKDGLPYIGEHKSKPGIYFALGFGGNGITFSSIAGEIIRDIITRKKNDHLGIFKFNR
jgi:glycine/D-amino acid oxidase-like deaminating enzyme